MYGEQKMGLEMAASTRWFIRIESRSLQEGVSSELRTYTTVVISLVSFIKSES
jgi:hypothetical protein